jgi:hypothetical protein
MEYSLLKLQKEASERIEELKTIEEYKTEQMKKLLHRKVFEQLQKVNRNSASKKEKE